ncbi:MAG: polyketide cyclase [Actinomycetota bacterium]|nr:polyketide cyclase [Actinomycetota bacterium]
MTAGEEPGGVSIVVEGSARATREAAFDVIVPIDLAQVFRGYGPLPAVVGTKGLDGGWDHVGATRVVELSDGSEAGELITSYERPEYFAYRVGPFESAPLRNLVDVAVGEWWFSTAEGESTAIRWSYTFLPRRAVARPLVRAMIGPLWRGYAKRTLALAIGEVERQAG